MKTVMISGLSGMLFLVGCSQQGSAPEYESQTSSEGRNYSGDRASTAPSSDPLLNGKNGGQGEKQRQLAFLNRIREADPQHRTIEKAMMNNQNELGIILDRSVNMDDIPALMQSLLKQMAAEFPNQDLTILAYAPSNPPLLIGTGRLDAQTREMTYTPAQPSQNRI